MNKLSCLAVVLAIAGVMGADAQGAELEGALQYPPSSIGKDAQPPASAATAAAGTGFFVPGSAAFRLMHDLRPGG